MTRLLINTHTDGYESDPALAVTLSYDASSVGPCFTLNGPDGEVEIVGAEAALAIAAALVKYAGQGSALKMAAE